MNKVLKQMAIEDLERMQAMPLNEKIERTKLLIKEFYEYFDGKVFITLAVAKIVQCY